jgi:hypothetical protein
MTKFISRWKLEGIPMLYDIMQHRAVFPIYSDKGRLIDANGRSLRGDTPKWLRYSGTANYYSYGTGSVAVVVEDVISAAVVGKYITNAVGVAILGTSMNTVHMDYLRRFDKVVIALDPDAAAKCLQFVQILRSRSISATAMKVCDDIKFQVEDDMAMLRAYCS